MSKKSQKRVEPEMTDGVMTPQEREEAIRLAAYYLWKKKGERHGEDRDDWSEAEDSFADSYND
jgi:hypothetical protein